MLLSSSTSVLSPLRLCAVVILSVFWLSGCGLMQGMQEPPEEEEPEDNQNQSNDDPNDEQTNACGGDEELTFQGERADRNDPCGPCHRDTLRCDESDETKNTLVCTPGGTPCRGPEEVSATTDQEEEVVVSWDHVDGADEYELFRDGDKIDTKSAAGLAEGEEVEFKDHDAAPATPLAPTKFEASDGDDSTGIELTWEFDDEAMIPTGESHDYEVVAVHLDFEDGRSDPVSAQGHTIGEFGDEFQYRRDGGDWNTLSNLSSEENEREFFDAVDEDEEGPNLPSVDAGHIEASKGEPGFDVTLQVSDFQAHPVETTYEVRALTKSGTAGAAEQTTGYVGVDQFSLRLQRSDDEDGDDEDFSPLEDSEVDAVFDSTEEHFHPLDPVSFVDTPPSGLDHHYRASLSTDNYTTNEEHTDTDRGFRGDPPLMTASRDRTLRRVFPNGEEDWQFEDFFASVTHIAVDPEGYTYAQGGNLDQGYSVRKLDSQGQQMWSFDDSPVDSAGNVARASAIAVDADGRVFASYESTANIDSKLLKLNNDGEKVGYWALSDDDDDIDITSIAVDAEDHIYITSTDGYLRKLGLSDGDDGEGIFQKVWKVGDEESTEASAVAVEPEGIIYWGSVNTSDDIRRVHRLDYDEEEEDLTSDVIDSIDVLPDSDYWDTEITDIVVVPNGRVYVATNTFLSETFEDHGALLSVDFDSGQAEDIVSLDRDHFSPITSIDVDLEGHLYYADSWFEAIYKLDSENDYDEIWRFEGHVTSDPDDPFSGTCDTVACEIYDIAVGPGHYGAFPDAWDD